MPKLPTPTCPLCGAAPPPIFDPETSMCFNRECKVIMWDATRPVDDLLTNVSFHNPGDDAAPASA